ncbi:hypothetical protein Ndes2526B_g03878 [Nannochloris sp. 'desiccata']
MQVYHLDQLISHLKHNIVYSNIALHVREWLRSQETVLSTNPQVIGAIQSFFLQTGECIRALRLALLRLVTPQEALQTVLNLQNIAEDIGQLYTDSKHDFRSSQEATIVHTMLITVHNIELLYRATDRALVPRGEPGIMSITDQKLGKVSQVSIFSLLNLEATHTMVHAVEMEEASAAAADEKKGRAAVTRDGVNEISGWMQVSAGV